MRRWWQTGPGDPQNIYAVKVWLKCGECDYQSGTFSQWLHHQAEHDPGFVSVGDVRRQTNEWRNEWYLKNVPGPHVWVGPMTYSRGFSPDGLS